MIKTSLRKLMEGRWTSWFLLVILFPLSVYGWAPDGLLESWYAPVHVVWAIACGAALHCFPGSLRGVSTLLLVACVYAAAGLVSWRALGWPPYPDRMPGPASGHPDLEALDLLAFLAAGAIACALWLRSFGGSFRHSARGRVLSSEGGTPC